MRRLWITRHKASIAGKVKMNVYIEDPENGDVELDGVFCRKLGELKNDQQKHFKIGNEASTVYVVSDKQDYGPGSCMQIPGGDADVFLEGRNCRVSGIGKPFCFDDMDMEPEAELTETRKSSPRWGKVILIIALVIGILAAGAGIGIGVISSMFSDEPQLEEYRIFTCQDLQITLTEEFTETTVPGYTACYSAGDTAVFLLREDFAAKEGFGELDLDGYGAMVLANNGLAQEVTLQKEDGLTVFARVITDVETGVDYYYHCGLFKGQDAFWMVQITTLAEGASEDIPQFRQWLKSVTLAG